MVRFILENWLHESQRARRRAEVRRFAMECAGTDLDLDPELEGAATEELRRFCEAGDETR